MLSFEGKLTLCDTVSFDVISRTRFVEKRGLNILTIPFDQQFS